MRRNNIKASWLHLSDLHVFLEADTSLMLDDYAELAKEISPHFLVVTGDFRHKKYNTSFSSALEYLELLISIFNIDKKDVFLVPGNHDVNYYDGRINDITDICQYSEKGDYNIYSKYQLCNGFSEYSNFVNQFYNGSGVTDIRTTDPSGVNCVVWNNLINIIFLNTALISDGEEHKQIVDINKLSQCKIDFKKPSILLGHHGIESLYPCHAERVIGVIDRRKISAYLHGDSHRYSNQPISKISTPNNTIPSITCAKSAPQSGDSFSDIGVVYYEWQSDDNIYVQAYRWAQKGFIEDSSYYYGINKKYCFHMIYDKDDGITHDIHVQTDIQNFSPVVRIVENDGTVINQVVIKENKPHLIGRSLRDCSLIVDNDPSVSLIHCSIEYDADKKIFLIMDLNSVYGTFLDDGTKLQARRVYSIKPESKVIIGKTFLSVGFDCTKTNPSCDTIKQTPSTMMIQNGEKNQQIGCASNFTITYN